jgi:hypothetical protein
MIYKAPHFEIFSSFLLHILSHITMYWTAPYLYFVLQVLRATLSRTTVSHNLSGSATQNTFMNLNITIKNTCILPTEYIYGFQMILIITKIRKESGCQPQLGVLLFKMWDFYKILRSKRPSAVNTYIQNYLDGMPVYGGLYICKWDLICTVNRFIFRGNLVCIDVICCCRFCGKWTREYFFLIYSEQSVDFS